MSLLEEKAIGSNPPASTPASAAAQAPKGTVSRIAGLLIALAGLLIVGSTFQNKLFDRAPALDNLIEDLRPMMNDEAIATLRADLDGLDAANAEFGTKVAPAVGQMMKKSPEELMPFMQEQFPAAMAGLEVLPGTTEQFRGLVGLLEAEQGHYASVDALPVSGVTPKSIPWMMVAIGGLFLLIGAWLAFSRSGTAPKVALVAGAIVFVGTFAVNLQSKAADADAMNRNVKSVFDPRVVEGGRDSLAKLGAMAEELQTKALPAIGEAGGVPPEELNAFMGEQFPALATALQGLPDSSKRFTGAVDLIAANTPRYQAIAPVPFGRLIWLVTWSAAATAVLGLVAMLASSKKSKA